MNGKFYDETGELLLGLFYELYVANDVEFAALGVSGSAAWVKSGIDDAAGGTFAYLQAVYRNEYQCKLNPRHKTDSEIVSCSGRFYGQVTLTDFIMDPGGGLLIVTTASLAKRIIDQRFTGVISKELKIIENQSQIEDPKLAWLDFSRQDSFVRMGKPRLEDRNVCPFCSWDQSYVQHAATSRTTANVAKREFSYQKSSIRVQAIRDG